MDTLEIIGKEQYDQINVGVPEALIKIISQIDQINGKNLSLKGLNESVISVKELQAQTKTIYDETVTSQQKAAIASKEFQQNRKLEIAGTKEAIAIQKEAAKQTEILRKLDIAGAKEAIAIQKEVEKQIQQSAKVKLNASKDAANFQKLEQKQAELLTNDYSLLSTAYNEAALRAKNYTLQLGANNSVTLEAVADAKRLGDTLKQIDASVGQNQRNVGNYSGSLTNLQFSIRNIASELPNLGISIRTFAQSLSNNITPFAESVKGIIAQNRILASEGKPTVSVLKQISQGFFSISTFIGIAVIAGLKLVEFFGKAQGAAALAEKANKKYTDSLNSVAETSRNAANEEISQLTVLTKLASDNEQTTRTRTRAVKELQETYPETFGALTKQEILEGKLADAVRLTTQALLDRAAAQAAEKRFAAASEQVYDLTLAREKAVKTLAATEKRYNDARESNQKRLSQGVREEAGLVVDVRLLEIAKNKAKSTLDDISMDLEKSVKEQKKFLSDAQESAAAAGDLYFNNQPKDKKVHIKPEKDNVNEILEAQKRLTDAERDAKVEELNRNISINEEIFQDDRNSIDKRSGAYAEMYVSRLILAQVNRDKELQDVQNWFSLYQSEVDKANATEKSKRTEHQQRLLIDYETYTTRKIAIDNKYSSDVAKINTDVSKDYVKSLVNDDEIKKEIGDKGAKDAARFQKQIKDGETKRRKEGIKEEKQAAKATEEVLRGSLSLIYEIEDASQAFSKSRISKLDAESDRLKSNLQSEIDAINASGDSESAKQKKIQDATARTAQLEQGLADQRKKEQIKQAELEKAVTIASIILKTALAVTAAIAEGDPFTKIPRAIAAGVLGAAQLAVAVSTPIPQYMEGTDYHKGGLAIVGDGGERELIREPNKNPYWSPSTDTLMNLAKGTSVTPLSDFTNYGLLYGVSAQNGGSIANNMDLSMLRKDIGYLTETVKNKKEYNIMIDRHGIRTMEKKANAWTNYLGRIYNR